MTVYTTHHHQETITTSASNCLLRSHLPPDLLSDLCHQILLLGQQQDTPLLHNSNNVVKNFFRRLNNLLFNSHFVSNFP
jgi:hypothetical protein